MKRLGNVMFDNIVVVMTMTGFFMVSSMRINIQKWGFLVMLVAQSGWVWIGFNLHHTQLMFMNVFFCLFSIWGAFKRFRTIDEKNLGEK
jgi:hypothetical protein